MIANRIFAGLLAIALTTALPAQEPAADSVVAAFQRAEQALVLLTNQGQVLPLQRLDTLRIAVAPLGLPAGNDFVEVLGRYLPVRAELPPPDAGAAELTSWLNHVRASYNLVIIGLDERGEAAGEPVYRSFEYPLLRLLSENRCVVVTFGTGEAIRQVPRLAEARALLHTPPNEYAQSLAAQLIFGGVGASGKLDADLSTAFRAGAGLFTRGGLRLRFSPPEVAGMDRRLLQDSVRAIVREGIARGAYPGAQMIVARNGHVVFYEPFGYHTYDSVRAVAMDDVYDFASLTKITTGLPAVMKLAGEGKFDLDAPWSRYYPEFKGSDKAGLSFRRLLTHSSRLLAWIPFWRGTLRGNARYPWRKRWDAAMLNEGRFKCNTFKTDSSARFPVRVTDDLWLNRHYKEKMLKAIRKSPLNEKPGYVYSDLSFYLWPEILPRLTGRPFEPYLKETFYRPLGAYSLTFNAYRHFPPARIVPTERDTFFRQVQLQGAVHDEGAAMLDGISGHAGLFGSAGDLAKLMQLYLNKGEYGGQRFIAEKTVEEFTRYQYPEEGIRRGLGFDKPLLGEYDPRQHYIAAAAGPASYGHTGYTGTFTWADPENGLLLIHFTNRVYPTRDNTRLISLRIRARLQQACYDAIRN